MAKVTLDHLNRGVDEKFGDFELEGFNVDEQGNPVEGEDQVLSFQHYLRLPKAKRLDLRRALTYLNTENVNELLEHYGEDADVTDVIVMSYRDAFRALARKPEHSEVLERALGEDSVKWTWLLGEYQKHYGGVEGLGESSPSNG